ncbi:PEP-CTERM sorting domain-containing protein [Massilia sp. PAMC28688]|uniref:PEP-CTERM sorting domain-containing protein n=1 Tax=Massilia sp. PAMC28688 TaxID=2861283 RepID=UPI001C62CB17|nr:PEP-CTERM sorting domain-containing protein [Massilia sp. PAMC28688]QYF93332.1 PEP-CTERM sorting domain-containing protein [Massilia sp. PAMC28688]
MSAGQFSYTGHTRMGDNGATSTMLLSQKAFSGTPAPSAAAAAAANTNGLVVPGTAIAADVTAGVNAIGPAAVPEPATGLLMLAGLLGAGALTRRRK